MSSQLRTTVTTKLLPLFRCLQLHNTSDAHLLGEGSVGSVFKIQDDRGVSLAVKIRILENENDKESSKKEVENQKAFWPFAPKVFFFDIEIVNETRFSIFGMELIDKELDVYLSTPRHLIQLELVVWQVKNLLKFLKRTRYTHGDGCLFNMAFNSDKKLIFIDFDQSSTKIHSPKLDLLRLFGEFFAAYRSTGTARLHPDNVKYLRKYGFPKWQKVFPDIIIPSKDAYQLDHQWGFAYNDFVTKAGLRHVTLV